jgi:Zn-dependent peptidase ImmA (M78 family)
MGRRVRLQWKKAESLKDCVGMWHSDKNRIDIARDQQPIDEADTVLHEVMHAVLHHQGREDGGEVEETYVRALATGTLLMLRSNPELAAWLLREIAE